MIECVRLNIEADSVVGNNSTNANHKYSLTTRKAFSVSFWIQGCDEKQISLISLLITFLCCIDVLFCMTDKKINKTSTRNGTGDISKYTFELLISSFQVINVLKHVLLSVQCTVWSILLIIIIIYLQHKSQKLYSIIIVNYIICYYYYINKYIFVEYKTQKMERFG